MKTRVILIVFFALILNISNGQVIQSTIKPGASANRVAVFIKPNFTNSTRYLYQIQIPIAWPYGAGPIPTGLQVTLDPAFITTFGNNYAVTVYPLANSTGNTDRYYVISLIRGGAGASVPQNWTSGTEYPVLSAGFTSSLPSPPSAQVKIADYADGGSDFQGNFYCQSDLNDYYVDPADSRGNFYPTPTISAVGGTSSDGYVQTVGSILLPINLLSFNGYKDGSRNQLRWTTSTELNNHGFEVQRSLDGVNYSSIGYVNSLAAGGTSSTQLNYTFNDNNVTGSKQFYRLRQIDLTGNSKLSNIVLIKSDKPAVITIDGMFPNPATTTVNLMVASPNKDKAILVITDMNGRTMMQRSMNVEAGSNTLPVDVSALAGGTYFVKLVSSTGEVATGKLVKQ